MCVHLFCQQFSRYWTSYRASKLYVLNLYVLEGFIDMSDDWDSHVDQVTQRHMLGDPQWCKQLRLWQFSCLKKRQDATETITPASKSRREMLDYDGNSRTLTYRINNLRLQSL